MAAWLLVLLAAQGSDKPDCLVAMERERANLQTGRIVWTTRCNLPPEDGAVRYRWHSFDEQRFFVSQFTPAEYAVEDLGDAAGVVFRDFSGEAQPDIGYLPQRYLWCDGVQWEHRDQSVSAKAFQGHRDLVDARAFGVCAALGLGTTLDVLFKPLEAAAPYDVRERDGLYEVSVSAPDSRRECRYALDPARGWNPVRVTVVEDGEVRREARSVLKQWGDAWFPERIELFDSAHADGKEPLYVVDVLFAGFNQPDDPQRLTPESIGIEVGTHIDLYQKGNILEPKGEYGWDGRRLLSIKELFARINAGELQRGAGAQAALDRAEAMGLYTGAFESEWERYVRRFIERYGLNREQSDLAWRILRDCQDRARQYVRSHQAEIDSIRARVREAFDARGGATTQPGSEEDRLKIRMLRIEAPIKQIFYGELQPRLEPIPTRAQRQRVAEREASARPEGPTTRPAAP